MSKGKSRRFVRRGGWGGVREVEESREERHRGDSREKCGQRGEEVRSDQSPERRDHSKVS